MDNSSRQTYVLALLFGLFSTGCAISDGYVVARPAVAVSGVYDSYGYGGVSVAVDVPPVYTYYSDYRRYYPPRVVYRRPYWSRPAVIHRTRVLHHHHHPAYRDRAIVSAHHYRRPVQPPAYHRHAAVAQRDQRLPSPRRNYRGRRR